MRTWSIGLIGLFSTPPPCCVSVCDQGLISWAKGGSWDPSRCNGTTKHDLCKACYSNQWKMFVPSLINVVNHIKLLPSVSKKLCYVSHRLSYFWKMWGKQDIRHIVCQVKTERKAAYSNANCFQLGAENEFICSPLNILIVSSCVFFIYVRIAQRWR